MSTGENRQVLEGYCAAVAAANFAEVPNFYADDATHSDLAFNMHAKGKREITEFYSGWDALITNDDYRFSPQAIRIDAEGHFVIEYIWRTRIDGEIFGVAGNGRVFELRGAGVGQVRDGKIQSWCDYYNALTVLAALGISTIPDELLKAMA